MLWSALSMPQLLDHTRKFSFRGNRGDADRAHGNDGELLSISTASSWQACPPTRAWPDSVVLYSASWPVVLDCQRARTGVAPTNPMRSPMASKCLTEEGCHLVPPRGVRSCIVSSCAAICCKV